MIPYITESRVVSVLNESAAYTLAHQALMLIGNNKTSLPPKIYLNIPDSRNSDFRAMPAYLNKKNSPICGIKWVSVFPANRLRRIPTVNGVILLNSARTGALLAVVEANYITALRTAAVAAVASHYLARPNSKILAIVGAGLQAEYQLTALIKKFKFTEVRVWGYRAGEAKLFCQKFVRNYKAVRPSESIKSCVSGADIVVTCTPSRKPLINSDWIKPGSHINAIGADAAGKQELDPRLLLRAKVVVDDWAQASHSGEINVPVARRLFRKKDVYCELSDIVVSKKRGRVRPNEITLFDSTGLGVFDIQFADYAYKRIH